MAELSRRLDELSPAKRALLELRKDKERQSAAGEAVAIVGLGCRFPGAAGPKAFWRLLCDEVDAITEVPRDRWDVDELYHPDPSVPGTMCTRWGGFVEGIDLFDPAFFEISPREAAQMDPQQRLLLEVAWETLEDAGIAPERLAGTPTGVFVGLFMDDYRRLQLADRERLDAYAGPGTVFCIAANRISYTFDLRGPSLAVDTACSSSLVAVHLACQSLLTGESTLALAGGVNVILTPEPTVEMTKAGLMSPDGRCKTFSARANGYVRSEGAGMVALKTLSRAVADGDSIYAVIRGGAVNQDGRTNGLTSPNRYSQEAVLREAYRRAGVSPGQVQYVEAHGTGTALGDAIETAALGEVLAEGRSPSRPLRLGSVKTNVGHLETAAGVASLIKVALAMRHGEIPASLHHDPPNPGIAFERLHLQVQTARGPWPQAPGEPRLAGVSSFGFGGTNAHLVLESGPVPAASDAGADTGTAGRPFQVLPLSARTETALVELARRYERHLAAEDAPALADLCFSAATGRAALPHRLAVVGASVAELRRGLEDCSREERPRGVVAGRAPERRPRLAFLFTGQGSLHPGVARGLYETERVFRRMLDRCGEALVPHLGLPLAAVLWPVPGAPDLAAETLYAQTAIFAVQAALVELWRSWGIVPDVVLGHSVGEFAAACAAGAMEWEDALLLVARRAALMQSLPTGGGMAAVRASEEVVAEAITGTAPGLSIAAVNGARSIVVSGPSAALRLLCERLQGEGIESEALRVSHAFHSALMDPVLDRLERAAAEPRYAAPRVDMVSSLTGEPLTALSAAYWRRQAREPVRFAAAVEALHRAGCGLFVEIGPAPVLLGMAARALPETAGVFLPSLRKGRDDGEQILESLGALHVHGAEVDWAGFYQGRPRRRVALPTYPFERRRCWIEAPRRARAARGASAWPAALLGTRLRSPALADEVFEAILTAGAPALLADHRVNGAVVVAAATTTAMAGQAASEILGAGPLRLTDVVFSRPLQIPWDGERTVQVVLRGQGPEERRFEVFGLGAGGAWTPHAAGRIGRAPENVEEVALSPGEVRSRCREELSGDSLHAGLEERGIALGPAFRWIEQAWRGEGEALCRLRAPAPHEDGGALLHPGLLDAAFQALAVCLPDELSGVPYLPFSLDGLRIARPAAGPLWCHARLRPLAGAETAGGDLRLCDDAGQTVAEVAGLWVRRAAPASLEDPGAEAGWLYGLEWRSSPVEAPSAPAAPAGPWLILTDAAGLGVELAALLEARGERCAVVGVDEAIGGDEAITGPDAVHRLATERTGGVPCRGAVLLRALDAPAASGTGAADLRAEQERTCGALLHLVRAGGWRRLVLVTRGSQVTGSELAPPSPAQAPLWGLGGVVASEHPELRCLRVDLDPDGDTGELLRLAQEMLAAGRDDQAVFRGGARLVPRLVHRAAPEASREPLHAEATYLITGGLGALGLQVAGWMVERGARHLVLAGRSAPSPTAEARLEAPPGGCRGDDRRGRRGGPVGGGGIAGADRRGAAGALRDCARRRPARRRCAPAAVLAALRRGARAQGRGGLESARPDAGPAARLLRAVLLGGAAVGSPRAGELRGGQCLPRRPGLPAPFRRPARTQSRLGSVERRGHGRGPGGAAPGGARFRLDRAAGGPARARPGDGGGRRLARGAAAGRTAAGAELRSRTGAAGAFRAPRPLSRGRRGRGRRHGLALRLAGAHASERPSLLRAQIREQVAQVLGLASTQTISSEQPLRELGLDSLMAVELRNRLRALLECDLPATLLFEYPTVETLTDYLLQEVLNLGTPAEEIAGSPMEPEDGLAASIAQLSETEAEALLLQKLAALRSDQELR